MELLREAGSTRYAIFRDGSTLFACVECEDPAAAARHLAGSPVRERWAARVAGTWNRRSIR